jgi:hypothetical protein
MSRDLIPLSGESREWTELREVNGVPKPALEPEHTTRILIKLFICVGRMDRECFLSP